MKKKQYLFLVIFTVFSGFLGGIFSNILLSWKAEASNKFNIITAQEFVVKDKRGNIVSKWGLSNEGDGEMFFFDIKGRKRISVGLEKGSPKLLFLDDNERPVVLLEVEGKLPVLLLKEFRFLR